MRLLVVVTVCAVTPGRVASAEEPAPDPELGFGEETIMIESEAPPDYAQTVDTTAMKLAIAPREVPQTVQALSKQLLADAQIDSLVAAHKLAPGVVATDSQYGLATSRGFDLGWYDVRKDGFRVNSWSIRELSNVERVEYLKGPASVLYGDGSPGGLVNLVLERPLARAAQAGQLSVGTHGGRGELDITGPLHERVRYRINAAGEDLAGVQDGVRFRRGFVAPALAIDVASRTQVVVDGELWLERGNTNSEATLAIDGRVGETIPTRLHLGDVDAEQFSNWNVTVGPALEHRWSSSWLLRTAIKTTYIGQGEQIGVYASGMRDDGLIERDVWRSGGYFWGEYFTDTYVSGELATGPVQHKLVVGAEGGFSNWGGDGRGWSGQAEGVTPLDPRAPRRGMTLPVSGGSAWSSEGDILRAGLYLQDLAAVSSRWKVLTGLRADWFRQAYEDSDGMAGTTSHRGVSPRTGVVFTPSHDAAVYASYSRSFSPHWGAQTDYDGQPFEPERGRQWEVGAKLDARGGRLSVYGAVFDIARSNVLTKDPEHPMFSITTGEIASRGMEVNVSGEVLPGWVVSSGYSLLEAFVRADNEGRAGNWMPNAPRHQVTAWSQYTWRGLSVGTGASYVGARAGDLENSFTVDGYVNVSSALAYKRGRYSVALSGDNLLDQGFVAGSWGATWITLGAPRRVQLALSARM